MLQFTNDVLEFRYDWEEVSSSEENHIVKSVIIEYDGLTNQKLSKSVYRTITYE